MTITIPFIPLLLIIMALHIMYALYTRKEEDSTVVYAIFASWSIYWTGFIIGGIYYG